MSLSHEMRRALLSFHPRATVIVFWGDHTEEKAELEGELAVSLATQKTEEVPNSKWLSAVSRVYGTVGSKLRILSRRI